MVLENMISEAIEGLFGYFLDHFGYNFGTQNALWHEVVKKCDYSVTTMWLQCDYNDFWGHFKLPLWTLKMDQKLTKEKKVGAAAQDKQKLVLNVRSK